MSFMDPLVLLLHRKNFREKIISFYSQLIQAELMYLKLFAAAAVVRVVFVAVFIYAEPRTQN